MKKIFYWVGFAVLALLVGGFLFVHLSPGYDVYIVRSESMKPTINMADLVISGPVNDLKPGMIVTYEHNKGLVTHRVLEIKGDTLVTKGDALEDPDSWPVPVSSVTNVYLFRIPYVGYLASFAQTKLGWFVVIIIPAMLLVLLIIKDILKETFKNEKKKARPAAKKARAMPGFGRLFAWIKPVVPKPAAARAVPVASRDVQPRAVETVKINRPAVEVNKVLPAKSEEVSAAIAVRMLRPVVEPVKASVSAAQSAAAPALPAPAKPILNIPTIVRPSANPDRAFSRTSFALTASENERQQAAQKARADIEAQMKGFQEWLNGVGENKASSSRR